MPLIKSKSRAAFSANVAAERNAGKPRAQALAIAYRVQREAKAEGGAVSEDSIMAEMARRAAAARTRNSVKPLGGRQEGPGTRLLTEGIPQYAGHVAQGLWDQATLPSRAPVAPPQGLTQDDSGRLWIGARPAHETPEGQAYIADQHARNDWAPGMALGMMRGVAMRAAPAGSIGMFAGPKAATADRAALDLARQMAGRGMDRRQIWDATGWFQGAEGKWRYEIPDNAAQLHPDLQSGLPSFGASSPAPGNLQHAALYEAYPELQQTQMRIEHGRGSGRYMRGSPDVIQVEGISPHNARSIALHEIQHPIQRTEGFSPGGNRNDFFEPAKKAIDELGGAKDINRALEAAHETYRRLAGEVEARNVEKRMSMTPAQRRASPPWETEEMPAKDQIVRGVDERKKGGRVMDAISDHASHSPVHYAFGGALDTPFSARAQARGLEHAGAIHGIGGGRADTVPMGVKGKSYVFPADFVSSVGQGNSLSGVHALNRLFKMGPYGSSMSGVKMPGRPHHFESGGQVGGGPVDIVASDGEFVAPPDKIMENIHPHLETAHNILDQMVTNQRRHTIKTLRKMKPPKKS